MDWNKAEKIRLEQIRERRVKGELQPEDVDFLIELTEKYLQMEHSKGG